jgi:O-antigen ligase
MIAAVLIGVWAAVVALAPSTSVSLALIAPLVLLPLGWWMLTRSSNWITGFFGAALLLPPLPIAAGNSGPHPALLFAAAGGWIGLVRLREWNLRLDPLAKTMLIFFSILLASVSCAVVYSGPEIAIASLARVFLFGIAIYIYLFEMNGPGAASEVNPARTVRWLLGAAFLVAVFACIDFYYQLPAPAGYGPQFVWLDTGVLRRAQGLFYEASTLGNFCAFFLVLIAVLASESKRRPVSRIALAITGAALATALAFSYSRASILCVACSIGTLFFLRGWHTRIRLRWMVLLPVSVAVGGAVVYWLFPAFAQAYWIRLSVSLEFFAEEPNRVMSGRVDSWFAIGKMIADHPFYLLTGIGYKTLPYAGLMNGGPIVADNMYLSLLIETGLPGLIAFLWMNVQILATAYRAAARSSLFGTWIFCFWTGEMVQMLSGDLFTYWRVLALYFWVLAFAARSIDERPVVFSE